MPIRRTILLAGSSLVAALSMGCGRDWDAFDPRLVTGGPGTAGASASASSGMGGGGGGPSASSSSAGGGGVTSSSASGSGGGGVTCQVSLQNDFNDGMLAGGPWGAYSAEVVNVAETSGDLLFELPAASMESVWGVFETVDYHDLTGCAVSAQVREVPNTAADAYTNLALSIDDGNYVEIVSFEGSIRFKTILAGYHDELVTIGNDLGQYAFWRIREKEGITYWETSPDGQTWKLQVAAANLLPFTSMKVKLGTGTLTPVSQSMGRARFDNLAIGP